MAAVLDGPVQNVGHEQDLAEQSDFGSLGISSPSRAWANAATVAPLGCAASGDMATLAQEAQTPQKAFGTIGGGAGLFGGTVGGGGPSSSPAPAPKKRPLSPPPKKPQHLPRRRHSAPAPKKPQPQHLPRRRPSAPAPKKQKPSTCPEEGTPQKAASQALVLIDALKSKDQCQYQDSDKDMANGKSEFGGIAEENAAEEAFTAWSREFWKVWRAQDTLGRKKEWAVRVDFQPDDANDSIPVVVFSDGSMVKVVGMTVGDLLGQCFARLQGRGSMVKVVGFHLISTGGAWARNRARRRRHQATEPQAAPPRPEQTRCAKCGSTATSRRKRNGAPMWLKGMCNLCYERARRHAQHVRHTTG